MTTSKHDTCTDDSSGSLAQKVRQGISQVILDNRNKFPIQDILRTIRDESLLQFETQIVRDTIISDPFELCGQHSEYSDDDDNENNIDKIRNEMENFAQTINVVECHRVTTIDGYSRIDAKVQLISCETNHVTASRKKSNNKNNPIIHLSFRYERNVKNNISYPTKRTIDSTLDKADNQNYLSLVPPFTVQYTIDLSVDHGPKERMLFVQVFTENNFPSKGPAKNLVRDESNIDDDNNDTAEEEDQDDMIPRKKITNNTEFADDKYQENPAKRLKTESFGTTSTSSIDTTVVHVRNDDDNDCDGYCAGIDPDVVDKFRTVCNLTSDVLDDNHLIFLLLAIPFYEQEWDLVGYLLESVFDENDSSDENTSQEGDRTDEELE
jgi:hypothetical protein